MSSFLISKNIAIFAWPAAMCNKNSKVYTMLDTMGLVTKPHSKILAVFCPSITFRLHQLKTDVWCWYCLEILGCPIPVSDDPDKIVIPTGRTSDKIVKNLLYVTEDEVPNNSSESFPLFGGHISWKQREESFKLKSNMKVINGNGFIIVIKFNLIAIASQFCKILLWLHSLMPYVSHVLHPSGALWIYQRRRCWNGSCGH